MPVLSRFMPKSEYSSTSTSLPDVSSMVGAWSWKKPMMTSVRPSIRAAILPDGSTLTRVTSSVDNPFSSSHAGKVAYIASPGVPATVLPARSAGSVMSWSAKNSSEAGPFCRNTPRLVTGIPSPIPFIRAGVSAQPKSVCPAATCWTVLPEPLPGLMVRSIPASS